MANYHLDDLNPPQREAVLTVDGPLLVLAGAGSGKTRVITYRIAHLLDNNVSPYAILAVSFTNKAADEMKERVKKLVGARGKNLTLSTFHALGLQILKAEKDVIKMPRFTIYDASDQLGLIRELLRNIHVDDRRFDSKAILFRISRAKNAFMSPDEFREKIRDHEYDIIAAEIYPRYQEALRGFHAFDFDDLITETVALLDRNEEVRERWRNRFRFVMVDEYQDTNRAQYLLMQHLVTAHGNLCVVGDDDQSIYGWRGAESGHILEFERQFPGAKVVRLEENYRSTPAILNAANAVIANNKKRHPKQLWTSRREGEKIKMVVAEDAEIEAKFVAEEIEVLRATRGYKLKDCAVLYRSNVQARPLEEALRTQRLNYRVVGGQSFFDRKEIKDAIAYLKLAVHPRDEMALRRIINYPARGIGVATLDRLAQDAEAKGRTLFDTCRKVDEIEDISTKAKTQVTAFCDLMERGKAALASGNLREGATAFLKESGLPDDLVGASTPLQAQRRLENLEGFYESLKRFQEREGKDLGLFLQRLMLRSNDDDDNEAPDDEITLTTLHGAKGLEFPVVFLVGLEEELLPHKRTLYPNGPDVQDANVDLGEERRLMYVGVTRAKEILYLTRSRFRSLRAAQKPRSPSRFLEEIPAELYETREAGAPALSSAAEEEAFARASLAKLFQLTE